MDVDMTRRGQGIVPLGIILERMADGVKGALGEKCAIRVVYRVAEDVFKSHALTLTKMEENAESGVRG